MIQYTSRQALQSYGLPYGKRTEANEAGELAPHETVCRACNLVKPTAGECC